MLFLLIAGASLVQQSHTYRKFFEKQQTVAFTGQLDCKGYPVVGAKLELFDKAGEGGDTKLSEGQSDGNGRFYLFGSKPLSDREMDPHIKIYHTCHARKEGSVRFINTTYLNKFQDKRIEVSPFGRLKKFVRKGVVPVQIFNLGLIHLVDFAKTYDTYY